jgi:ribosome-associated protein
MIEVSPTISIDENDIQEEFTLASGPGGQNVNKVSTAVRLRFNVDSTSIPDSVRERLISLARGRITEGGLLIIEARRFRTQAANRKDALGRLIDLVRKAAEEPTVRHKTRPTQGSKERRLKAKHHRAETKQARRVTPGEDEG